MNLDFLKKIPGLKNLDFDDAKTRRNVLLGALAGGMVILVIALKIAGPKEEHTAAGQTNAAVYDEPSAQDAGRKKFTIDVGEGADRDVLAADNMIAARERGVPGNRDLFAMANSREDDDPAAAMRRKDGEEKEQTQDNRSVRERAEEAFGIARETPASVRGTEPQQEEDQKPAPKTVKVASATPQKTPKKAEPEPVPEPEPAAVDTTPAPQPVRVRRSGGISSMDGDWGSLDGLSSLDEESQYLVEDYDHPYKVMFIESQKIKSGDRVTLRLLEDMVAGGVLIPKNTHLSATCQIGDRLMVTVSNIEIRGKIYTLDYIAFDNDGNEGIYCPNTNASRKAGQAGSSLANTALSTATTLVSAAAGTLAGTAARVGAEAITGRGGNTTATVNSGYTFYLLKK